MWQYLRAVTFRLTLLLSIGCVHQALAEPLYFPVTEGKDRASTSLETRSIRLLQALFYGSEFSPTRRHYPPGGRIIMEWRKGRVDVAITSVPSGLRRLEVYYPLFGDKRMTENYPTILTQFEIHFFAAHHSSYPADITDSLNNYRLGVVRGTPKLLLERILDQPLGAVMSFNTENYLVKGLLAGRVDIILLMPDYLSLHRAELEFQDALVDLGEAFTMDLFLTLRTTLPEEKRRAIVRVLDRNVPKLKQQGKLHPIMFPISGGEFNK